MQSVGGAEQVKPNFITAFVREYRTQPGGKEEDPVLFSEHLQTGH